MNGSGTHRLVTRAGSASRSARPAG